MGRSSLASISPTDMVPSHRWRGESSCRALIVGLIAVVCLHPSKTSAEGFGPFPVRNFHPLQQLVLNMPVTLGKANSINGLKSALDQPEFLYIRLCPAPG